MRSDHDKSRSELIAELNELRQQSRSHCGQSCRVMDGLPQFIFEADLDGKLTYVNDYAIQEFGYSSKDAELGFNIVEALHPDFRTQAMANFKTIMDGGKEIGAEYVCIHKDGTPLPVKVFSRRIMEGDTVVGIRGVVIDISDMKEVERALRKSEDFYRTLFENTGTAMSIIREDGIIRSCNTQFAELANCPRGEIEGIMRWSEFVDESELKRMQEHFDNRLKKKQNPPQNYEFLFRARGGEEKWINLFVRVIPRTNDRVCSLIDNTAHKSALEALKTSEEQYQLVVRGANDGVWDWDTRTDNVWYSPRYKEIIGYTDDEFPNRAEAWIDHIHPDDLQHVLDENMKCVQGDELTFQVQYRMRHKDGSYRWILGRGTHAKDETGKVVRLAGTHTDITAWKETEQALRKSEERYRVLVEQASSGIYRCTVEGKFITVNSAMAKIFGYDSPQEFIDAIDDIGEQLWLDKSKRDDYRKLLEKHERLNNYEIRVKRKDGSRIWISENVRAVRGENGKVRYYDGFMQDITAKKLSERTTHALYTISKAVTTAGDLSELYATIHASIDEVITANNFYIALYNEATECLEFVYDRDEKNHAYNADRIHVKNQNSLTINIYRTGEPLLYTTSDPSHTKLLKEIGIIGPKPQAWLGVPLKHRGTVIGAMVVQDYKDPRQYSESDVSFLSAVSEQAALAIERKSNEEALTRLNEELESKVEQRTAELIAKAAQLEAANERLRELDAIKSSLVSSVSHELRTPLTSIRGFAKLCTRDFNRHFRPLCCDEETKKRSERLTANLDIIDTEGDRLTRLINDFLDINRIESGKASWHDQPLDPVDVICRASHTVSGSFASKPGVRLITNTPKDSSLVIADPDKLHQVLINLLNNAFKFTDEGSVTLSFRAEADAIIFSVADTGTGIPKVEQDEVFEKFHRSMLGDTITKDKGTGLGLAICKEIVEHYGGAIWVDSTPGQGSVFSFALPPAPEDIPACS